MRRMMLRIILFLPVCALFIVLIFLAEGRTRLSDTGVHFVSALVYCLAIGVPTTVVITWLNYRWPRRWDRFIVPIQVLIILTTSLLGSAAASYILVLTRIIPAGTWHLEFRSSLPFSIVISLAIGLTMTTYQTLRYKLQAATIELATRQAEQERAYKLLAEARLASLESRIHPHFLFNTLNSIAALIPCDPQRAEDTVGKLASLLRFSLTANPSGLVPLSQELKIVRDYLEIESTRFGPRLRYSIEVPDSLSSIKTPPLALQSLVENAVKHVAAQRIEGATLLITAARKGDTLRIEVIDDGPGFTLSNISPEHGLGNLIGRLDLLFGEHGKLGVTQRDNLNVVSLEFPAE